MVKYNPTLNPETTLAQWRQSIKAIDTPYVKQYGYGVATAERLQSTLDFVQRVDEARCQARPRRTSTLPALTGR